jgi:hypothetical protein
MPADQIAAAPCIYWHTKVAALNGGRDKLTDEELEFVGVGNVPATRDTSGGWIQAGNMAGVIRDRCLRRSRRCSPHSSPSTYLPGQEQLEFLR